MRVSTDTGVGDPEREFWEAERLRTAVPVRVACILGILAFISYGFLDPFVSDNVQALFIARAAIVAVHLGLLAFSFTQVALRHFRVLALLPCFAIGLGVVVVTQLAGGGESRYHEALLLTFFAYPLVVPTRPVSAGLSFAAIAATYAVVMAATGVAGPPSIWITNNATLWAAVVIATAGVALGYRGRRKAVDARTTIMSMREERLTWLESLAHFLRHELSNQIVAVSTSIDLAKSDGSPFGTDTYLERAQRSLGRMRGLVSSATEATSLEAALAVDETESVDLSGVVVDRVSAFQQLHPSWQLTLKLRPGLCIDGNEERLAQLLDKLLGNAVEHSAENAEIRVELRHARNGWVELTVENEGDALPEDKERIFEAFVSSQQHSENLGLGLFVARSIAHSHRGEIAAEELPDGQGARFVVRLPLLGAGTHPRSADRAPLVSQGKGRSSTNHAADVLSADEGEHRHRRG